jgi:hypothetical protein
VTDFLHTADTSTYDIYGAKRLKPTTSGTRPPSKCMRVQLPTLSPPTTQSLDGTKGHFLIEGASANRKMARRINFLLSWLRRSEKIFCMGTDLQSPLGLKKCTT